MSTSPEATRHQNSTKLQILLPFRAIQFRPFQYDTPCKKEIQTQKGVFLHTYVVSIVQPDFNVHRIEQKAIVCQNCYFLPIGDHICYKTSIVWQLVVSTLRLVNDGMASHNGVNPFLKKHSTFTRYFCAIRGHFQTMF